MIPPLLGSGGSQPVETLSFVHIIRMTVTPVTPHPALKIVAKAPLAQRIVHVAIKHALPQKVTSQHTRAARSASPVPRAVVASAVTRTGDAAAGVKSAVPVAVTPAPPAAEEQSVPARSRVGGMLPLGVDEPSPVLDPAVLKALVALGVHVTLTVTVDENGHTKAVAFAPPLDAATEDQIRSMLASASWDPAVCGAGMACEADATIKL
jgi:hypothetical protein